VLFRSIAIHNALGSAIDRHKPSALAIEKVIFVQSYATAIILGAARGVAVLAAAQRGLSIHEYPPKRGKQAVVGKGAAAKEQVAFTDPGASRTHRDPPQRCGGCHRHRSYPFENDCLTRATGHRHPCEMISLPSPRWLGRISYEEGLKLQESLVAGMASGEAVSHLLLLEHHPVYTMGRSRDESSLRAESLLPHPVHRTNRGGQATYQIGRAHV